MKKTPQLYDAWNECKKEVAIYGEPQNVQVGQVWRYYNGVNIGSELSKDGQFTRPCLVLKTKCWNGLVLVAPITTKYKQYKANYLIPLKNYGRESYLIINQVQFIDKRRFANINRTKRRYMDSFVQKVLLEYTEFVLWDFR